jgi:hypothetical protein
MYPVKKGSQRDQEQHQDEPGDGHNGLLADRRLVKEEQPGADARLRGNRDRPRSRTRQGSLM